MPYRTDKASQFTAARHFLFGLTWYNIRPCDLAVIVLDFYNPGGGFILVSGTVGSVTQGQYCDARLQFCYQKLIVIAVYHLF